MIRRKPKSVETQRWLAAIFCEREQAVARGCVVGETIEMVSVAGGVKSALVETRG